MSRLINLKFPLLFIIIVLAAFLRFWQLGQNPPSLTWDEAAWGYNAYSLGIDGKDEFGRFLPFDYLESFGDFKPPVYAYLDIIPVKIFGLNEFSVRFPSAFFGVLTVLATYFLVKRIFGSQKSTRTIALVSSFLLAISPWHIMLSRAAFEANLASFFLIAGVWLFLVGIQKKPSYLILSAIFFALSLYTFNTARVVAPILVLILAIGFRKQLFQQKRGVLIAVVIGILLVLPTLKFLLSPQASLRFKEVNIFSDVDIIKRLNQDVENDKNAFWSKIIHNRRFAYGVEFLKHYLDNFSPNFLFINGDGNPKFSTQDVGQLYLWELPFLILGILFLIRNKEGFWWLVPLWLIIGIIPAATARETPHALRIETALPTFQLLVAYGLISSFRLLSKYKYYYFGILSVVVFLNFFYYIYGYYVNYPYLYSREWQYGYKDSIAYVEQVKNKYDQIYMTMSMGRPYIYYLFYTKTNPQYFRKTAIIKREVFGFVTVEGFDKYRFAKDVNIKHSDRKLLLINILSQVPSNANILKKFYVLDGTEVLVAYTL